MARVLQKFVASKPRYPWSEWSDKRPWRATQGKDFSCTPDSFRASLYSYARRKGLTVKATIDGKQVDFQFAT